MLIILLEQGHKIFQAKLCKILNSYFGKVTQEFRNVREQILRENKNDFKTDKISASRILRILSRSSVKCDKKRFLTTLLDIPQAIFTEANFVV
jgi:hypothetical protein